MATSPPALRPPHSGDERRGPLRRLTRRGRSRGAFGTRAAVLQFAVSGLAALLVVGLGGAFLLRELSHRDSIADARQLTEVLGTGIVEPAIRDGILAGDRRDLARLDRTVRTSVVGDPVVRVKLWTAEGRIVYSDERRLRERRYPLEAEELAALRRGGVKAELMEDRGPENRYEPDSRLLEVYFPVETPTGTPLLFEAYLRYSSVVAGDKRLLVEFAGVLVTALVLLWLVQLPLALSLVRRLRRGKEEREELLLRAIDASDAERRRIAGDLHDGVVQDLAGITFSLDAAAGRARSSEDGEAVGALEAAAAGTRHSMRRVRSLLVDIYPPNLHTAGLAAALSDTLSPLSARGIEVELDVAPDLRLPEPVEQLMFRTAQEALRNVVEHADAGRVTVAVTGGDGAVTLTVADDGRGFTPEQLERRREEGHLGLALLADRATDLGGALSAHSAPGKGTTIRLEVPLR